MFALSTVTIGQALNVEAHFTQNSSGGTPSKPVEKPEVPANPVGGFTDVKENDWFADAVKWAVETGLMNGTTETTFAPQAKTTRAMVLTMLYRQAGSPNATNASVWYADAAKWAMETGVSDGSNLPGEITREQLVTMLWRAGGSPKAQSDKLSGFADADKVSGYAKDAVAWAIDVGVLTGKGHNNLDPLGTATRAETAAMFMRLEK